MKRSSIFNCLLLAVALGALAFRLPGLGRRPMHLDEAVQAVKAGALMETGAYRYDPHESHGPTLYYFSLPSIWLRAGGRFAATDESTFRLTPALFGVGLVLVLYLLSDGLGHGAALYAGVLTAISPAFVFYSRFYMQEPLLVFFTACAIAAGWRFVRTNSWSWAVAAGACVGFMHATKETCVIAFGSMLASLALTIVWGRCVDSVPRRSRSLLSVGVAAGAIAAGLGVSLLFFSSFVTNLSGPMDSLLTYAHYFKRAAGETPHVHAWHYYLEMLTFWRYGNGPAWSEGLILVLCAVGLVSASVPKLAPVADVRLLRFLGFYTLAMAAAYSIIPYKTPWCMLSFLHGMILLAGVGADAVVKSFSSRRARTAAYVLMLAAAGHLAWQAYRASFPLNSDPRNPYVYAQTSPDIYRLAQRVEAVSRVHPYGPAMVIKVVTSPAEYWPLPWYLRRFPQVGYWHLPPEQVDAPVVITSPDLQPEVEKRLRDKYQLEYFGLRPGVLLAMYVQSDLWDAIMKRQGKSPH